MRRDLSRHFVPCLTVLTLAVATPLQAADLIINGDFEINTAAGCDFDLTNADFDATVSDATAFGTAEEIDVMMDAAGCGFGSLPHNGLTKLGIATVTPGGLFDAFSLDLSPAVIAGHEYTLSFFAESVPAFGGGIGDVEIGLSSSATSFGTLVFSGTPAVGVWTHLTTTFIAPVGATFLTVRQSQAVEAWTHIDEFSLEAPCPWDCGDGNGEVNTVDFLAVIAGWGGFGSCDFDGGGVGITDFLTLLIHWGPCP